MGRDDEQADPQDPSPGVTDPTAIAPPRAGFVTRIPVHVGPRVVIVPAAAITRLEAQDNYVRIWAGRPYLRKETLTSLVGRLDPSLFLRVHRSHAVNLARVRELAPRPHGEFALLLDDGTRLLSGRSYRDAVRRAFGLGRPAADARAGDATRT